MDSNPVKSSINQEVFNRIKFRVIQAERENFKTQRRKPNEMNDTIRKIIEVEVDKDAD